MPEYEHAELRDATPRQWRALRRMHEKLGAEPEKVGRWPFRRREWRVTCPTCGWKSDETIAKVPPEMTLVETYLLKVAMERHLVDALRELTFADVWLGGRR